MKPTFEPRRRSFVGALAAGIVAADATILDVARAAEPSSDIALPPVRQIEAGDLDVGYVDAGPANGPVVLLLHGWPYDIHSFSGVVPRLVASGFRTIVPHLRGYGTTRFRSAATPRNGEPAALAVDMIALLDALHVPKATVAGFDWGARTVNAMAALWPERCEAMVSVSGYLIGSVEAARDPLPPTAEHQWWYQYYFATERGRSGYARNRREFARLIWQLASPRWRFGEAEFERSAVSFDNPDHVDIVIHNYRYRLGLAEGEPRFEPLERRLSATPRIAVPTITMEGDANGAPHPPASAYADKFSGPYAHRIVGNGTGHNLPQEAPSAFAAAIRDVRDLRG